MMVPEWQEQINNVSSSSGHFLERIYSASNEMESSQDKISFTLSWLQDAERDANYLANRIEDDPLSADHRHIAVWRSAFEHLIDQYQL